jgi:hypothetical protein
VRIRFENVRYILRSSGLTEYGFADIYIFKLKILFDLCVA